MAPAIVHFLVGASLALLLATPLALRGGSSRHQLWLVAFGGTWGMVPDLAHVTPRFAAAFGRLHATRWADAFGFHYALDRPPVDSHPLESTAAAVCLFLGAVLVFSASSWVGTRDGRTGRRRASLPIRGYRRAYAVVVTAALVCVCVGVVLTELDRLDSVAALLGRDRRLVGWALVGSFSLVAAASFAALLELLDATLTVGTPARGAALGLPFALCGWAVVVAIGLPVWMSVVLDLARPLPYLHVESLLGFAGVGLLLGVTYPLVRGFVDPPPDPTGERTDGSR